jgi:hypothetical protein
MPRPIDLHFAFKGLDESRAYAAQAGGQGGENYTTASAQNVCGYDPKTGRNRGSSRGGLAKWCSVQVNGSEPIQDLAQVIGTVEAGPILLEDDTLFLQEDGLTFIDLELNSQVDIGTRLATVVATSAGNVYTLTTTSSTLVTSGTAALSSTQKTLFSTQFQEDLYFCDGVNYKYYDVSANSMVTWTATSGTLPVDANSRVATIIERWNNRLVLSGVTGDPRVVSFSAVGDAFDFDYAPDAITTTMAVALAHDDIVTAFIPYTDDVGLIGGDHSIYRLSGDPADGGRRDLVSDSVGIAFGRAWCKHPDGTVFFFGSRGGIYRIDPTGGIPQRLTAKTIDERLADVDMDTNLFRLVWDDRNICVRIYITPRDSSEPTTHYIWDVRNEAWWPCVFGEEDHNPIPVLLLSGYSADDRTVLLGCQDGYVRMFDPDSSMDDGHAIESFVFLGPWSNVMIQEFQATLGNESGNLNWSIHEADNLQDALDSPAVASGRWQSGRNRSQWPRRYIRSGYVRLASTEPWALERIVAMVEQGSAQRGRIF